LFYVLIIFVFQVQFIYHVKVFMTVFSVSLLTTCLVFNKIGLPLGMNTTQSIPVHPDSAVVFLCPVDKI